jgi:hypothetical protein
LGAWKRFSGVIHSVGLRKGAINGNKIHTEFIELDTYAIRMLRGHYGWAEHDH